MKEIIVFRGVRVLAAGSAMVAAAALAIAVPTTAGAATGFCGLTGFTAAKTFVWTGGAPGTADLWQDAANWEDGNGDPVATAPGDPMNAGGPANFDDPTRDVDYACIGKDADGSSPTVTLGGGLDEFGDGIYAGAAVAALDLGQGANLVVTGNSRLWLNGHRIATPVTSTVRPGSTLTLQGATFGGAGALTVSGTLRAVTAVQSLDNPADRFVVTITTRWCDVVDPACPAAATTPGLISVAAGGLLAVDSDLGVTRPVGINLEDSRRIQNAGTIRLLHRAFVAADHGTVILNQPPGTIDIQNNGGVYEGRARYGLPNPVLTNRGLLTKSAGVAVSVIGATYSQPSPGQLEVDTGTLTTGQSSTTAGTAVPPATVAAGGTYGLGGCTPTGPNGSCPTYTVDSVSPQAATATLSPISAASTVVVATQTGQIPTGAIGQAVQFNTPQATPSTAQPNIFTMLYDASIVPPGGLAAFTMKRADDNSATFVTVPNCRANGTPPVGKDSCVDRRGIAGVSSAVLSDGDVKIVIRTTVNSRWVGV